MANAKPYLPSSFWEKYDYFLGYLEHFWQETGHGHMFKGRNQNLTYPIAYCSLAAPGQSYAEKLVSSGKNSFKIISKGKKLKQKQKNLS